MNAIETPVPKYKIGDVLFTAGTDNKKHKYPCPDCLGTKTWKIVTPAGTEIEIGCRRCGQNFDHNFPTLEYYARVPNVTEVTLTGVAINICGNWHSGEKVEYNVGSAYYRESQLFPTHEEALAASEILVAEQDEKRPEIQKIEATQHADHSRLTVLDARFKQVDSAIWNAGYKAARVAREINDALTDEFSDYADDTAKIQKIAEIVGWENECST